MGVDINKLPTAKDWMKILQDDFELPIDQKHFYYIIWLANNTPIGHSNINKIHFGKEAHMHLHLWNKEMRQKGMGRQLIKSTLPYYFNNFKLQKMYCEPYALNPAPNKILQQVGFDFEKTYETIPGWINYFQPVNRWVLTREKYNQL